MSDVEVQVTHEVTSRQELESVKFAVYVGEFEPEDWVPGDGRKCYKYGHSSAVDARIKTHESGREYPKFKLTRILEVESLEEAQGVESALGIELKIKGWCIEHRNFKECFACTEEEMEKTFLEVGKRKVEQIEQVTCQFCDRRFACRTTMVRHQRTHAKCIQIQKSKGFAKAVTTHKCPSCEKEFTRKESCGIHMRSCAKVREDELARLKEQEACDDAVARTRLRTMDERLRCVEEDVAEIKRMLSSICGKLLE
jgi:predicted GIY-YIG superfamily endonuclease